MKNIAQSFKILGNDNRLKIMTYLASGEKCVCNIFKKLNLSQNLVSHHLGILRKTDIIEPRKDGKWVYYSLNYKQIAELKKLLSNILKSRKTKTKC